MAVYPHIKPSSHSVYDLDGRAIAEEFFEVNLHSETFSPNAVYWLQKATGGSLIPLRLENHRALDLPESVSSTALSIDSDRSWQELRLYVGNTSGTATVVENDTASNRRYRLLFRALARA